GCHGPRKLALRIAVEGRWRAADPERIQYQLTSDSALTLRSAPGKELGCRHGTGLIFQDRYSCRHDQAAGRIGIRRAQQGLTAVGGEERHELLAAAGSLRTASLPRDLEPAGAQREAVAFRPRGPRQGVADHRREDP